MKHIHRLIFIHIYTWLKLVLDILVHLFQYVMTFLMYNIFPILGVNSLPQTYKKKDSTYISNKHLKISYDSISNIQNIRHMGK